MENQDILQLLNQNDIDIINKISNLSKTTTLSNDVESFNNKVLSLDPDNDFDRSEILRYTQSVADTHKQIEELKNQLSSGARTIFNLFIVNLTNDLNKEHPGESITLMP